MSVATATISRFMWHHVSCVRRCQGSCSQWNISRIHGQLDELKETIGEMNITEQAREMINQLIFFI